MQSRVWGRKSRCQNSKSSNYKNAAPGITQKFIGNYQGSADSVIGRKSAQLVNLQVIAKGNKQSQHCLGLSNQAFHEFLLDEEH